MFKTDPGTEVSPDGVQQLCGLMLAHIERRGYPSVERMARHHGRDGANATGISAGRGSGEAENAIS